MPTPPVREQTSKASREYLPVKFDDPNFTLTILASSAAVEDSDALASSDPTNGTAELELQWQPIEWSRHSDEKAREKPYKIVIGPESCR